MAKHARSSGPRSIAVVNTLTFAAALLWAFVAAADDQSVPLGQRVRGLLDNPYFKVDLNVRARVELADFENLESSQSYTVRTLAGVGSKPIYGLSAYAGMRSTLAIAAGQYFDTVEAPTGQSPIADPEDTDLNQLFARYQNPALLDADIIVGRQRIILDDHRFIGNVGWRQNEQVFDAARASTSLGIDHLSILYGYIDYVSRIFGNEGPPATRDFRSDSHILRVGYERWRAAQIAAFAYLLDFENSPMNSSNSYGVRITGTHPIAAEWSVAYAASYALQTDAGRNPVDYVAHYVAAEGGATHHGIGGFAVGYELLGSDDGKARFVTPLSTAHKFNGWADAFLDNGGLNGLRDLYASFTPQLPLALRGGIIYHYFWSDEGSDALGYEVDGILQRSFGPYLTLLAKVGYFDGRTEALPDRWRATFDVTFDY